MKDPTAQEMRDFLKACQTYGDTEDMSFEVEEAIYWFAYAWHGGQWTNLYSALSTSPYSPGPKSTGPEDNYLLDCLVEEYVIKPDQTTTTDEPVIIVGLYKRNVEYVLALLAPLASLDEDAAELYLIIHDVTYSGE